MNATTLCHRLANSGGRLAFSAAKISSTLSTRLVTMLVAAVRNSSDPSAIADSRQRLVAKRVYSCKPHSAWYLVRGLCHILTSSFRLLIIFLVCWY